jgi:hypothetical protein
VRPTWGRPVHVVEGDLITLTLDTIEGTLSMEAWPSSPHHTTSILRP